MDKSNLSKLADYMVEVCGMDEKKITQMDPEDFFSEAMDVVELWIDLKVSMKEWVRDIATDYQLELNTEGISNEQS